MAADVCAALALDIGKNTGKPNVSTACRKLAADQSRLYPIQTSGSRYADRKQDLRVVSESGLYKLVLRSDKADGKRIIEAGALAS